MIGARFEESAIYKYRYYTTTYSINQEPEAWPISNEPSISGIPAYKHHSVTEAGFFVLEVHSVFL